MITTRSLTFCLLFFSCVSAFGQTDSLQNRNPEFRYFTNLLSGGLFGESKVGSSLNFSMTHGLRYKRIFAGVGVGYDAYRDWQVMPVFAVVGLDIATIKENAIILQVSAGHGFARHPSVSNDVFNYESDGGRMIHPAIGYRIKAQQWSLYLMAGYKFQQINYTQSVRWWTWSPTITTVEQNMERLTVQLGFGLH